MLVAPKCGKFDTSRGKNISEKVNYSCFAQVFCLFCILGLDIQLYEKKVFASDFHILCTFFKFSGPLCTFYLQNNNKDDL